MADGGKLPNHGQAAYLSRPDLTDPSHLVSQARDGYINYLNFYIGGQC